MGGLPKFVAWTAVLFVPCVPQTALGGQPAVSEEVIPPRLHRRVADLSQCYPRVARRTGLEGRVVVSVIVQPDGTISSPEFPADAEVWQQEAARCVLPYLRFTPGTKNGVPVALRTTIPIALRLEGGGDSLPGFESIAIHVDDDGLIATEDRASPRLIGKVSSAAAECRRIQHANYKVEGDVEVEISVDAQGRPAGVVLPGKVDPQLAQLAQCTAIRLRFEPAHPDHSATARPIRLQLQFPAPPSIKVHDSARSNRCWHKVMGDRDIATRFIIEVTIGEDGRVVRHALSADAEPWMGAVAQCVLDGMAFRAARYRGRSIQATATLPIGYGPAGMVGELRDIVRPKPKTSEDDIIRAYADCYPQGWTQEARIGYRITVSTGGEVLKAKVLESSGNERLDEAGACIVQKLKFEPASLNGVPLQVTVGWPILVRPPPDTP